MSTQTAHPWRATLRTVVQLLVALAAAWPLIVSASGVEQTSAAVAGSLALAAAVTRIMALPVVDDLLRRFLPWLASTPRESPAEPDEGP